MRGIVSLAAAFGLPLVLADGTAFPHRAEIILITVSVIVVTLVLQGLTLAPLIRWLRFPPDQERGSEEEYARSEALRLGLETLEDLAREPWARSADVGRLREEFRDRIRRLREGPPGEQDAECRLRAEILDAERRRLVRLRNENAISDDVLLELEQELDLEALRIGRGRAALGQLASGQHAVRPARPPPAGPCCLRQPVEAVQPVHVDRQRVVGRGGEDVGERHVPPHFVPEIGGPRREPGREGLVQPGDQHQEFRLGVAQPLGGDAGEGARRLIGWTTVQCSVKNSTACRSSGSCRKRRCAHAVDLLEPGEVHARRTSLISLGCTLMMPEHEPASVAYGAMTADSLKRTRACG